MSLTLFDNFYFKLGYYKDLYPFLLNFNLTSNVSPFRIESYLLLYANFISIESTNFFNIIKVNDIYKGCMIYIVFF